MSTISSRMPGARPSQEWLVALTMPLVLAACWDDQDRSEPEPIYFSPTSILQESSAVFRIEAPGMDLRECQGLGAQSLTFRYDGEPQASTGASLQTLRIDLEDSGLLRAHLYASADVLPGEYSANLVCDSLTRLSGKLRVRPRNKTSSLHISPSTVAAGSLGVELTLTAQGVSFVPGESHVIFGDGSEVEVTSVRFSSGPPVSTMWVQVDVSEDAAVTPADAPMEVAVVTGPEVVRGTLAITSSVASLLKVSPATVDRPPADRVEPLQYTLRILSQNMEFSSPDTDTSTETEEDTDSDKGWGATTVTFPENPGVQVASVDVASDSVLEATVLVYPDALTHGTPLVVQSQGKRAVARLTVRSARGHPMLELSPRVVPFGAIRQRIWMRSVDFPLDDLQAVTCLEDGCTVDGFEVTRVPQEPATSGFFWLTLASPETLTVTIEAKTAHATAIERLRLVSPKNNFIEARPSSIERGANEVYMTLFIHGPPGAQFSSSPLPVLSLSPRSGVVQADKAQLVTGQQILLVPLKVAKDAPLGPVTLSLSNGSETLETQFEVVPSGNVEDKTLQIGQSVVSSIAGKAVVEVASKAVWGGDSPKIWFDDPGVSVENFERLDASSGRVTLSLSPSARSTGSVMYASGTLGKAAASLVVHEPTKPIFLATKTPSIALSRTKARTTVHFRAASEAWQWDPDEYYLPEIMEGIGIEVSAGRVDPTDPTFLVVDFVLSEIGPGGLLGIAIPMGNRLGLAYLPVQGSDQSLTLTFDSAPLSPGDKNVNISTVLPEALDVSAGIVEAFSADPNVAVRMPLRVDSDVQLRADVAWTPRAQVPVYVRGTVGVAVGLLAVGNLNVDQFEGDGMNDWAFLEPQTRILEVLPEAFPAIVGFQWSGENPGELTMASTEGTRPVFDSLPLSSASTAFLFGAAQQKFMVRVPDTSTLRGRTRTLEPTTNDATMLINFDPCVAPFLVRGKLDDAFESHFFLFTTATTCETAFALVARSVLDQPWVTADTTLELRGPNNLPMMPSVSSSGWPFSSDLDPTLYCPPVGGELALGTKVMLSVENAAVGEYLLNVRRPYLVRELSWTPGAEFIEIEGKPGASTQGFSVELLDLQLGVPVAELELSDAITEFPSDGVLVIAGSPQSEADIVHVVGLLNPTGGGAIALLLDGEVIDSVQWGQTGAIFLGEGRPIADDEPGVSVYGRIGRMDTNDNSRDFFPMAVATPGQ